MNESAQDNIRNLHVIVPVKKIIYVVYVNVEKKFRPPSKFKIILWAINIQC